MRFHGPPGAIGHTARFFESKVSRRIDVICSQNQMMTRAQARKQALEEMADKAGSPAWEKQKRRDAEKGNDGVLKATVRKARKRT